MENDLYLILLAVFPAIVYALTIKVPNTYSAQFATILSGALAFLAYKFLGATPTQASCLFLAGTGSGTLHGWVKTTPGLLTLKPDTPKPPTDDPPKPAV